MAERSFRGVAAFSSTLVLARAALGAWPGGPQAPSQEPAAGAGQGPAPKPQARAHAHLVPVDPSLVQVDDGDSVRIFWPGGET